VTIPTPSVLLCGCPPRVFLIGGVSQITVVPPSSPVSYALGSMIWEANALGWQFTAPTPKEDERDYKLFEFLFIGFTALSVLLLMCVVVLYW